MIDDGDKPILTDKEKDYLIRLMLEWSIWSEYSETDLEADLQHIEDCRYIGVMTAPMPVTMRGWLKMLLGFRVDQSLITDQRIDWMIGNFEKSGKRKARLKTEVSE